LSLESFFRYTQSKVFLIVCPVLLVLSGSGCDNTSGFRFWNNGSDETVEDRIIEEVSDSIVKLNYDACANLASSGDCNQAISCLESYLSSGKQDSKAHRLIGVCQFKMGNFSDAKTSLSKSISMGGMESDVVKLKALAHLELGEYQEGLKCINDLLSIESRPEKVDSALLIRARIHVVQQNIDQAIVDLESIHTANILGVAALELGKLKTALGQIDEAYYDFAEAVRLLPDSPIAKRELGMNLFALNDYDMALKYFDILISDLNNVTAVDYYNHSEIMKVLNNPTLAVSDLNSAIQLDSTNAEYYGSRSRLAFSNGNYVRAIQDQITYGQLMKE
jgi:tetratricopeptide (TPR) repeat protein